MIKGIRYDPIEETLIHINAAFFTLVAYICVNHVCKLESSEILIQHRLKFKRFETDFDK